MKNRQHCHVMKWFLGAFAMILLSQLIISIAKKTINSIICAIKLELMLNLLSIHVILAIILFDPSPWLGDSLSVLSLYVPPQCI